MEHQGASAKKCQKTLQTEYVNKALLNFDIFNKISMHKEQKRVLNHLQTSRKTVVFLGIAKK